MDQQLACWNGTFLHYSMPFGDRDGPDDAAGLPHGAARNGAECTRSSNFGWMRQRRRLLLLDPRRPWLVAGSQHGWDLQGPKYVWCRCLWFTEINMPNATLLQNQEVAEAICEELNKDVKPHMVRELMSVQAMCKKI